MLRRERSVPYTPGLPGGSVRFALTQGEIMENRKKAVMKHFHNPETGKPYDGILEDWETMTDAERTQFYENTRAHPPAFIQLRQLPKVAEDDIRRIVREEMSRLLDGAGKKAGVSEDLEAEKLEDALIGLVEKVSFKTQAYTEGGEMLRHYVDSKKVGE